MTLPSSGTCTLVGAGPGDPELLTLKAVKAIQRASILLVDDLVSDEILAWARPDARIVHVGKRGGCKSTPQAFIDKLMIASVRNGEHVVRLKGGDPFIFGRGGEEVEALREAGITCEVVNGITAGLAAATSIGVPLTHRHHAHGALFMTGHSKPGHGATDWASIGACAQAARLTLVIYMGVNNLADIVRELLHSMPGTTPVAVVENASRPEQRQLLAPLGQVVNAMTQQGLGSPSILVVGEVLQCAGLLADALEQFGQKNAAEG